jgi:hypothetical protein
MIARSSELAIFQSTYTNSIPMIYRYRWKGIIINFYLGTYLALITSIQ